jgi:hypothetical protein
MLTDYLASCGIIYRGQGVTRLQVVVYVSNRLGGAHYDPERQSARGQAFVLLDEASNLPVNHLTSIYNELWAIGQDLARSGDARRFLKLAKPYRRQPEDGREPRVFYFGPPGRPRPRE